MDKSKVKIEDTKVKIKKKDTEKGPTLNGLRENSSQSFKDVIKDVGINEFYTQPDSKKRYNKFVTSIVPEEDYNYMSDLIEMPTTSKGFKWLLVMLDLATNEFDIEAMKSKTADSTLNAFKLIIKRGILKLPEISLKTDNGTEFLGSFRKFLTDHGVMHKTSLPYRKQQMGPVESLNKTVARILMTFINDKSVELGKDYYDWTDILDIVREEVNSYRKRDLNKLKEYQSKRFFDPTEAGEPEFQVGDYVHWKMDRPTDIRGTPINDSKFRMGDRIFSLETRKIVDILCYPSKPYYRYKLQDMVNVSYSASELKKSEQTDNYFIIKKIIGVKTMAKKKYNLCWWKGTLKADATWESEDQLLEDDMQDYIDEFKQQYNKKKR
jgi:transposase InsO family protein